MDTQYNLVFTGELHEEAIYEDVVRDMLTLFKMDRVKAEKLLATDKPVLLKKGLNRQQAEKLHARLETIGLQIQLRKARDPQQAQSRQPAAENVATPPPPQPKRESSADPQSESATPAPPATAPENPYASPKADLNVTTAAAQDWLGAPRKVPSSHGWVWIVDAMKMFLAQPWKWMGMVLVVGLILIPVSMIPIIGFIPQSILAMVFGGGLMLAAQSQAEHGTFEIGHAFKGFSHNRNQLILVGVLYMAGFLVIALVMALIMGGSFLPLMLGGSDPEAISAAMESNMPLFFLAPLVAMALSIPLMMCFWFATGLVAISGQKAVASLKLSFSGCLRNILPFLVYGLAFLFIGIAMMIGFSVITGLLAFFFGENGSMLFIVLPMLVLALVAFPLMVISGLTMFTSFKDVYYEAA